MRLLLCGDAHLGKGQHLHPDRLAEQERVVDLILEQARSSDVDGVLMLGDMFDSRKPPPEVYAAAFRPLVRHRQLDGPRVIAINGNGSHDLYPSATDVLAEDALIELHREPGHVLVGDTAVTLLPWAPVSRLRARLGSDVTIDEVNQACAELLVQVAAETRPIASGRHVLMTHYALDGSISSNGQPVEHVFREPILSARDLAAVRFDVIAAGHVHRPQMILKEPPVLYVGSPLPLAFDEGGFDHGYWLLEDDGVRFVPIESPRFLTFDSLDHAAGADVTDAYVRVRVTSDGTDDLDAREIERSLVEDGARCARVEVIVERAARARVGGLDDTVDDGQAFDLWLAANEIEDRLAVELRLLDKHYREEASSVL